MRSGKRYSNATFTKRVDHDAGRHRTRRSDPEPAYCQSCGAIWAERRWSLPRSIESRQMAGAHAAHPVQAGTGRATVCPACRQQQDGVPGGFVYLEGAFLNAHRTEIEKMLRNEASRSAELNPLSRIMTWEPGEDGGLTIGTTTDHLALRLGRALESAFGGDAKISFSHENRLTRVRWRRD